jgi:hypothetical protein
VSLKKDFTQRADVNANSEITLQLAIPASLPRDRPAYLHGLPITSCSRQISPLTTNLHAYALYHDMTFSDINVENLEVITTRRLRLHRPMEQDADAMFERYASDATVTKFLGWPTHESVEDTRQFLQTYSNVLWNKHKVGPYLISDLESGMLLGSLHWIGFFK